MTDHEQPQAGASEPLSAARLAEIRHSMAGVYRYLAAGCDAAVIDLLAEIDRLRTELAAAREETERIIGEAAGMHRRDRQLASEAREIVRAVAASTLVLADHDEYMQFARPKTGASLRDKARALLATTSTAPAEAADGATVTEEISR